MLIIEWPHSHLPHALAVYLTNLTAAQTRIYTRIPRERTYPLLTVMPAGLGMLGTDAHIQADQPRLQIDAWAEREDGAASLAAEVFKLLDFRFAAALREQTLATQDDLVGTTYYRTQVERIERSGGGESYFDEYAQVFRCTTFYGVKVNI